MPQSRPAPTDCRSVLVPPSPPPPTWEDRVVPDGDQILCSRSSQSWSSHAFFLDGAVSIIKMLRRKNMFARCGHTRNSGEEFHAACASKNFDVTHRRASQDSCPKNPRCFSDVSTCP